MWLLALKIVVEKFSTAEKREVEIRILIFFYTFSVANSDLISAVSAKYYITATLHIQLTQPPQI